MKTEIMFAVASLMLVGAVIVFALTNAVEASKPTQWCTAADPWSTTQCFNAKGQCQKFERAHPQALPCQEEPR